MVHVTGSGFGTARRRWPPETGSQLRIQLGAPAIISGTVTDLATGRLLAAVVTVVVRHPDNYVSQTARAERGTFEIRDLPAGPGIVVARAEGYAPTVGSFTAEAGRTRDARVGLLLEAQAAGQVVDNAGEPVQWAYVRATYPGMAAGGMIESLVGGQLWTDADGNFAIDGLTPDTPIALQAEFDGRLSSSETIVVGPGMRRTGVVLTLP